MIMVVKIRGAASGWRAMDSTALLPIHPMANPAPRMIMPQPTIKPTIAMGVIRCYPLPTRSLSTSSCALNLHSHVHLNAPETLKIRCTVRRETQDKGLDKGHQEIQERQATAMDTEAAATARLLKIRIRATNVPG